MGEKQVLERLSEAEKEITRYQQERDRWINYTIDLQRIIEALCDRRGLPEPVSTARHHYNMANEYLSSRAGNAALASHTSALAERDARIAELEAALVAAKEVVDVAEGMTSCRSDDDFVWAAQAKINAALAKERDDA